MSLDPVFFVKYAALIVGITFTACTVLLWGFRRGRLRAFNITVVFVIALLGIRLYAQLETGSVGGWWGAVVWLNLAVCGIWGVIGMLGIMGTDPPVSRHDPPPPAMPPTEQPEP